MTGYTTRDGEYSHDGTRMIGYLCAPEATTGAPGMMLIHDAFGLGDDVLEIARRFADLGIGVFAADLWGERRQPTSESEIGPIIGAMVNDRGRWMGRIAAAQTAVATLPEIDASALVVLGYCFGGSSALEFVRTGGAVRAVVGIHAGLDVLGADWTDATSTPQVLICTGADDHMASEPMRAQLQSAMTGAGIDWEIDLYSDTKHAFTNPKARFSPMPDVVGYHPRNAARAWDSTVRFLHELFPHLTPHR